MNKSLETMHAYFQINVLVIVILHLQDLSAPDLESQSDVDEIFQSEHENVMIHLRKQNFIKIQKKKKLNKTNLYSRYAHI